MRWVLGMLLAVWLLTGMAEAAAVITHGPLVGQVKPTRAKIWLRLSEAPMAGAVVEYSTNAAFSGALATAPRKSKPSADHALAVSLDGLVPETQYYYRIRIDGALQPGIHTFSTIPPASRPRAFSFAVMADFSSGRTAPSMVAMAALDPKFVLIIGDYDHRDPADVTKHPEGALAAMRKMRKDTRGANTNLGRSVRDSLIARYPAPQIPIYNVWDDHDYCYNGADKNCPARDVAMRVYREYFLPASLIPSGRIGLWQNYRYGREAEIFLLDLRSNRDKAKGPDGPEKSMLGAEQKAWFKQALLASTATWKIIISSVPFNPGTKIEDSWGAYLTEHQELLQFITGNGIKNVVVLSGDVHSGGAVDFGEHSGLPEVSVPNANTGTAADSWGANPGLWTIGPLSGVDNPGFAWVEVGLGTLEIAVRGADGLVKTTSGGTPLRLNLAKQ
jgi:alkaline phosphatase D